MNGMTKRGSVRKSGGVKSPLEEQNGKSQLNKLHMLLELTTRPTHRMHASSEPGLHACNEILEIHH
ncbi:hypothetical protein Mapa_011178 [Marchantia paleacea]|nr:hypothetical protein Mapa_011178 [Marchantia paleacea]